MDMENAEVVSERAEMVSENIEDVSELVSMLELANAIIKRQHDLLVKHGIDPKEGEIQLLQSRIIKA